MKFSVLIGLALAITTTAAGAADTIKIDVHLAGNLQQTVSLTGPNSIARFAPPDVSGTTLELRLIAPEPVILELKETTVSANATTPAEEVIGRVKLATPGSSFAVSDLGNKGQKFHSPYVLVRPE